MTLPRLGEIRSLDRIAPEERGLFHGVTLTLEQSYSHAADIGQPTNLRQDTWQTALGVSTLIGDYGFASITGVYSGVSHSSTNVAFGLPMAAGGSVVGADAVIGLRPLPLLSIGVLGGYGSGFASYTFVGFPGPATPANSSSTRFGGFLATHIGNDWWSLTGSATVVDIRTNQDYGPMNIPQFDSFGATLLLTRLEGALEVAPRVTLSFGATLNTVLGQTAAAAQTGIDTNWLTLDAKAQFRVSHHWSVFGKAATWVGNQKMSFTRVSAGASYRF